MGRAVFDRQSRRLRDLSGKDIALRHRSREVLGVLVRHRSEIVSRPALACAAWDVKTVSDDSIAQCIADIRRALSDHDKRIVETVPRQGYRLVVPAEGQAERSHPGKGKRAAVPKAGNRPNPARPPVIAVLPFEDLGIRGIASSAFRAVLAEAIITDLARNPELTVLSRNASFGFSGAWRMARVLARLRADYLVTGAVVSDEVRTRVSVRLVSAEDMSCARSTSSTSTLANCWPSPGPSGGGSHTASV